MIIYTLDLVKDYIAKTKAIEVKDGLSELMMGQPIAEADALEYWDKKIPKEINDRFGRLIKLGDAVFDSLFKDPDTGKKVKEPENFNESRAKRLPWIAYTLKNTDQVYELSEKDWITYFYTLSFVVKYKDKITGEPKTNIDNYLIVTKKKAGTPIQFVTAYNPDTRLELLKKICKARPYNHTSL